MWCTAERREICLTCLSKKSIPAIPFWISKPPIPPRSRFLRAAVRSTRSALCLHHAHPFVAAEDKNQSHAEKQRVWSRSCGLQDLLRNIQWLCPRFGLQDIDCALSCDTWWLLPAFQPPMFSKCDALPKGERFVWHVCLRNPFPLFLLGIPSIHSQPEAGFWEPQYVPPGLHYGCIMPIPSLQLQKKNLSHAGKQSGRGVVVSKICYNALIVLSIVLGDCCKRMNDCQDWAFSNIALEE